MKSKTLCRRYAMRGLLSVVLMLPWMLLGSTRAQADEPPAVPEASQAHYTAPEGGVIYKREGEVREIKLTAIQSGGRYTVVEGHLSSGARVPAHFHKWHAEMFYVLGGEADWTVNGVTHHMTPGSLLYIPPGAVHSVQVGKDGFHSLLIDQPGGHEYEIQRQQEATPAQMRDPKYQQELGVLNDFFLAGIGNR